MALCTEKTKSGKQCRAKAMANGRCAMHQHPDRAKELAKKSIESRRKVTVEAHPPSETLPPRTPEEVVTQLGQVFADVRNGKVDVSKGRTLANLAHVILRGLEIVDLKKQLKQIEELVRERYYRRDKSQEAGHEDLAS